MTQEPTASPEFSHPFDLRHLDAGDRAVVELEPDGATLKALGDRLGLVSLSKFTATLGVTRLDDGSVAVDGRVFGDLAQRCGVTLVPIPEVVDETVELLFLTPKAFAAFEAETAPEDLLDGPDVEPLESDILDLGEIATQSLALGLDPFPRDPTVDPVAASAGEPVEPEEETQSPFAKLAGLKRDR